MFATSEATTYTYMARDKLLYKDYIVWNENQLVDDLTAQFCLIASMGCILCFRADFFLEEMAVI